ncbi:MAG TPA: FKBP-type peptidyl-prolyl cis-trans isomerase, partial [Segetibacter sp.]
QITNYAIANGMTVVKHPSGMFYQIIDAGTGLSPTTNATIKAIYTGKLLNGTIFDYETMEATLSGLIEGWQIGMPLIKKGGKIKLIIPSALAYGCNGNSNKKIGANQVLFYDITLVDVK